MGAFATTRCEENYHELPIWLDCSLSRLWWTRSKRDTCLQNNDVMCKAVSLLAEGWDQIYCFIHVILVNLITLLQLHFIQVPFLACCCCKFCLEIWLQKVDITWFNYKTVIRAKRITAACQLQVLLNELRTVRVAAELYLVTTTHSTNWLLPGNRDCYFSFLQRFSKQLKQPVCRAA